MVTDFDLIDDIDPPDHTAKNRVLAVEEWGRRQADIELAAARLSIGIDLISAPRHGQGSSQVLLGRTDFRREFIAGPAATIARRVTSLNDKAGLHAVEGQLVI